MATGTIDIQNLTWYALTSKTTLTTAYAEVSTYNSRKISDYNVLVFELYRGDWIIGTVTVMTGHFTGSTGVAVVCTWGSESIEYDIKYVNDTKIEAKKITSSTATISFRLCGLTVR